MKDGGQAFPSAAISSCEDPENVNVIDKEGMTVLDYFAGQALEGFCSDPRHLKDSLANRIIAEWSYEQAVAMLEERDRRMKGGE